LRASLRPPPKLHVRFSRMQLSRRLSDATSPDCRRYARKSANRSRVTLQEGVLRSVDLHCWVLPFQVRHHVERTPRYSLIFDFGLQRSAVHHWESWSKRSAASIGFRAPALVSGWKTNRVHVCRQRKALENLSERSKRGRQQNLCSRTAPHRAIPHGPPTAPGWHLLLAQ